jgi:HEPN domain-containing protein
MQDSNLIKDWYEKGNHDITTAKISFSAGGPNDTIGVLLQQAFEKYIKGYLLSQGWKLKKIHDLRELIFRAQDFNPAFGNFLELARRLTAIYVEDRYPTFSPSDYPKEEIESLIGQTEKLISFIKKQTK